MYSKCKCCVSIVAERQTTNRDEIQKLVTMIKNDSETNNTNYKTKSFVIQNNVVRDVNRIIFEKWSDPLPAVIDLTVEEPYIPANIVHRMYGHLCKGLHRQIHTVDVVTDMLAFNVLVIAKSRENIVVAMVRTIETDGPTCTINWHTEIVKRVRLGGSEFTDMLNHRCQQYYTPQATEKSVEKKEVREMPPPVSHTKASHIQPSRSYMDHEYTEYDMDQVVAYSMLSKSSNKKRKDSKPGYRRGTYKKRKDV